MEATLSATAQNRRALLLTFGLTFVYFVVEVAGGLLTNSLALLADAGHMLPDVGGLGLALFAANIAAWGEIDKSIAAGQKAYKALKYAPFPVVAAPAGMALGGGCEIVLHADAVQAHAETYLGLVECGVGLIPGWGGCGEMLARWRADPKLPRGPMPASAKVFEAVSTRYLDFIDAALEIIRSTYYDEPASLGYLGWISLRFQGRSRAYLSPHHGFARTCTIRTAASTASISFCSPRATRQLALRSPNGLRAIGPC